MAGQLDEPADGAYPGWTVGRYLLTCQSGNGMEGCVSNAPDSCPDPGGIDEGPVSNCVDQCNANEFAVAVGWIGPGPQGGATPPNLPAGCRFVSANPGGIEYQCCPCE